MAKAKKVVAVFGANRVSRGEPLYHLAEETGREIAGAGWTLLNGGYGGTMEADVARRAGTRRPRSRRPRGNLLVPGQSIRE